MTAMRKIRLRFLNKIRYARSGCWIWTGAPCTKGKYGHLNIGGKYKRAHRIAYELFIGPIPKKLHVLHNCDTPLCVNPDHLFVGTQYENLADMTNKGRRYYATKQRKH